jgi:hypothetical protein
MLILAARDDMIINNNRVLGVRDSNVGPTFNLPATTFVDFDCDVSSFNMVVTNNETVINCPIDTFLISYI